MASLYNWAMSYWGGDTAGPSIPVVTQEQLDNVKLKTVEGNTVVLVEEQREVPSLVVPPPLPSMSPQATPQAPPGPASLTAPPGPARFLPKNLKNQKLNSITVPASSILITQEQLNNVKLEKAATRKPFKFFVSTNPVLVDLNAAVMIRAARCYKKYTSAIICAGIALVYQAQTITSVLLSSTLSSSSSPIDVPEVVPPVEWAQGEDEEVQKLTEWCHDWDEDWSDI